MSVRWKYIGERIFFYMPSMANEGGFVSMHSNETLAIKSGPEKNNTTLFVADMEVSQGLPDTDRDWLLGMVVKDLERAEFGSGRISGHYPMGSTGIIKGLDLKGEPVNGQG